MHSSVIIAYLYVYCGHPGVHSSDVTILNAGRTEASCHPVQETSLVPACANPARRQDLAARGDKKQEGPKTRKGGTNLKYFIGCMQQPGGQT